MDCYLDTKQDISYQIYIKILIVIIIIIIIIITAILCSEPSGNLLKSASLYYYKTSRFGVTTSSIALIYFSRTGSPVYRPTPAEHHRMFVYAPWEWRLL